MDIIDAKALHSALPYPVPSSLFPFAFEQNMCEHPQTEYIAILLLHGADPYAPIVSAGYRNAIELATAAANRQPTRYFELVMRMLDPLRHNIDASLPHGENGENALAFATDKCLLFTVRWLLEGCRADPNASGVVRAAMERYSEERRDAHAHRENRANHIRDMRIPLANIAHLLDMLHERAGEILRMLIMAGGDPTPFLHLVDAATAQLALALCREHSN
jgi:hypothetical protein